MFALVDCNNFYASCERAFRPELNGKPIAVLSNNDGCVIARSNELKTLGIKMGVPYFQIKDLVKKHNIQVFSSNYTLYGDLSNRVMSMLSEYTPDMEVYSIDEAFLKFDGFHTDLAEYGRLIAAEVKQGTGIPVSLGIAPTKTLAKVANKFAKKFPAYKGCCYLDTNRKRIRALELTAIEDVWGIGYRHAHRLKGMSITNALQFSQLPREWVRKNMTVVGERMWRELNGEPCIEMEYAPEPKKQICTSRAFGHMLTEHSDIAEAVSTYACICAQKLREQNSCATSLMVFIHTNNFIKFDPQYHKNIIVELPVPTNSSIELSKHALWGLKKIFAKGYRYKKAGVIITEIVGADALQQNIFTQFDHDKHSKLMKVMDNLNSGFNDRLLTIGTQGIGKKWKLNRNMLSPCYTTNINDILVVK